MCMFVIHSLICCSYCCHHVFYLTYLLIFSCVSEMELFFFVPVSWSYLEMELSQTQWTSFAHLKLILTSSLQIRVNCTASYSFCCLVKDPGSVLRSSGQ